jgi:hypothetical protein
MISLLVHTYSSLIHQYSAVHDVALTVREVQPFSMYVYGEFPRGRNSMGENFHVGERARGRGRKDPMKGLCI